jgi:membrane fusion protein, adhesin transport system
MAILEQQPPDTRNKQHVNGKHTDNTHQTVLPGMFTSGSIKISDDIHSLNMAQTPRWLRSTSIVIIGLLVLIAAFFAFVPWQQNVTGNGKITSFVPGVRPQTIDAPITARVMKWFVNEGMQVKAGDTLAILQDLNASFMDNDFIGKIELVRDKTIAAQNNAIETARMRTIQSTQRELASKASLENARIEIQTSRIRYKRAEDLTKEGLAAQRELETGLLNLQKAQADSIRAETALESAKRDVEAARNDESRVIQQADALVAEAELRVANAQMRGGASIILAPIDGYLVSIAEVGAGHTVKDGETLARIVPTAGGIDQAVEILISSRDAAIVDVGRPVRLQFSGFPAFVFNPGWQNFTINTFGGRVAVVDAVDDGNGYYRVLVVPDSTQMQGKWPPAKYLRQGTPSTGWIMLSEVSVGFEIWRQLNGFPAILPTKASKDGKDAKKEK